MNANKIAFALIVLLLAVAPNLHAAKCSNASLNGTDGFSSQGFTEVTPDHQFGRVCPIGRDRPDCV
jgi:hypothetical protein